MLATILNRLAAAQGIRPGLVDEARRRATPHIVDCIGLCPQLPPPHFEEQLREREAWCKNQCPDRYEIEPIRQDGSDVGRRFRFPKKEDAALFKLWFC
jgi:hypothetical protein